MPSFIFIILKNEKGRNKYSFSSLFIDILLIETTDLELFCSIINLTNNSFVFSTGSKFSLREVEVKEG